jgi:osmotically-inducible protein OsmY
MSMHRTGLGSLWACAAAVAVTIGCAQTDVGVTTSVKSRLASDDTVKAYQIDVDTTDHVVTLSGIVDSPAAKERAITLARQTEGVRNVIDNIRVGQGTAAMPGEHNAAPTTGVIDDAARDARAAAREAGAAITDGAITAAVKSKLMADAAAEAARIDVDTKDHVVTLTGTVSSAAEKTEAVSAARATSGVREVRDRLVVEERAR